MRVSTFLAASVLVIAASASAVTMDWTPIGNPGNACEINTNGHGGTDCYGGVGYAYDIGTYEVTNSQYAEFLNAKATSDPLGLYNTNMGNPTPGGFGYGGITRSGGAGSYTYSTIAGRGDMPVNFVSFYDTLRFANWMNNGQGGGDTETGAYTLLGGTPLPSNGTSVTRNAGATIVLTSENEWYKAAYYDASTTSYFDYPAGSNTQTTCSTPTTTSNRANCENAVGDLTTVGAYTGSTSPYGTFDQGGNVLEHNETIRGVVFRNSRGGAASGDAVALAATLLFAGDPAHELSQLGFRLVLIPEPSTGLLVTAGLIGFAVRRRART